jgi:hypothetical protein
MLDLEMTPPSDDTTRPIPPRYWWLKRILLAVGVLIVGLVVLRLWWGYEAERRLQAKIDELRAAGEPLTPEDFELPALPDEKNAAYFYRQAAAAIVQPVESRVSVDDIYAELADPGVWGEYEPDVAQLLAANAEALRLARAARSLLGANWNISVSFTALGGLLPELSAQRALAKLLPCAAEYQHHVGDHGGAVEALRDALAHAKTFSELRGYMISHLVLTTIDALSRSTMESIFPTLIVMDESRPAEGAITAPRRAQVEALLAELLDERYLRDNWRWALPGNACAQHASARPPGGPGRAARASRNRS